MSQSRRVSSNSSKCITSKEIDISLEKSNFKKIANDMVYYLLAVDKKKYPIKQKDIIKAVMNEYSKYFPKILEEAKKILLEVFGILLTELKESKQKSFILINALDTPENSLFELTDADAAKFAFLHVILTVIFMNGNSITDNDLMNFLEKLNLINSSTDKNDSVLGDVKKLVSIELVRQGYLKCSKEMSDSKIIKYEWGERASLEFSKKELLNWVCKIYGPNVNLKHWTQQYREAVNENINDDS